MKKNCFIAIDLKSFYASVECVERGLDPLTTNLVVADASRTEKTICLAVSPSLKAYGIAGRARLFEVIQRVREINAERIRKAPKGCFQGKSSHDPDIQADPTLELDYITAPPQMALYMKRSTQVFSIYMQYVAPEDIHVYSVDEVFIDATDYLAYHRLEPREFARQMIADVLAETGITATAGIGTNLYLAKVAMDIVAKHLPADADGVRIAELDEMEYRKLLWSHEPITDFWRVGRGTARRLARQGLYTMGDIARCSIGKKTDYYNEDLLYKLFGVNAELLIDHAWGWEPCTMKAIKEYLPQSKSLSSGQVLAEPYDFEHARLIIWEMTDLLCLDLVSKRLLTDQMVISIGYDAENLTDPERRAAYSGPVVRDFYGRPVPKESHGSINLSSPTSSSREILNAVLTLFDRIADPSLTVRRMYVVANNVIAETGFIRNTPETEQMDLFTDYEARDAAESQDLLDRAKERSIQETLLALKARFGKNAVLKGANFKEGATTIQRNGQIGGHKAE